MSGENSTGIKKTDEKRPDEGIARRSFLTGAGAAGTAVAALTLPAAEEAKAQQAPAAAAASDPRSDSPLILNATENAFVQAVVDTFIPADGLSPSGTDCGVAVFIDRQLAGAYGRGAKLYRSGPYFKGKPEHGYQLPLTPYEFIRAGNAEFINAKMFFEQLYALTIEGFFADPIYGGNRNKVAWKMIGYPGLPANYGGGKALEYRGKKVVLEPKSIGDFS